MISSARLQRIKGKIIDCRDKSGPVGSSASDTAEQTRDPQSADDFQKCFLPAKIHRFFIDEGSDQAKVSEPGAASKNGMFAAIIFKLLIQF